MARVFAINEQVKLAGTLPRHGRQAPHTLHGRIVQVEYRDNEPCYLFQLQHISGTPPADLYPPQWWVGGAALSPDRE